MYRLLIVDDEPYTVDGLFEMLSETRTAELDLYRAYSAEEAMRLMSRAKMDVVLSDIRMPETDGIQLQRWIRTRWPRCKIIFLTGLSDIQYAQQAMRGGGLDYVLKTEGDEAILRSILRAVEAIAEEYDNEQFLVRAKQKLRELQPLMQKEWFDSLLDGGHAEEEGKPDKLRELGIPLRPGDELLMVCGRIDQWKDGFGASDQMLMMYAIQNIAEEYLEKTRLLPMMIDHSHFVWLLQPDTPGATAGCGRGAAHPEMWKETVLFVQGTLESIQTTCKRLLKLPVSFICSGAPFAWSELPKMYNRLRRGLILGLGGGEEMLMTLSRNEAAASVPADVSMRALSRLQHALETGRADTFDVTLTELFHALPNRFSLYAQAYYSVAIMLLSHMNQGEAEDGEREPGDERMDRLMNLSAHKSKDAALRYLRQTAAEWFQLERLEQDERTHRIILTLNRYILEHLNQDLSLAALSERVYLNPSYLSSLYKKYTGKNISEYITELRLEKAREMLADTPAKVHEIAESVGFETAGYFTRFFKKHTGMTPQEYRSSQPT